MTKNVLIVAERGPQAGLGHFSRCMRIRSHLSTDKDFVNSLLVVGPPAVLDPQELVGTSDLRGLQEVMERWAFGSEQPKIVLLDAKSPELMSVVLNFKNKNKEAVKLCVIDRWDFPSDLIDFWFIPSFHNRFGPGQEPLCDWSFGWDCILLPTRPKMMGDSKQKSIFVNFGSSPHFALNSQILSEIVKVTPPDWRIELVIGEYTKVGVPSDTPSIVPHRGLNSLRELQEKSLIGFTIYGVTLYEQFQSGVASVTLSNYSKLEEVELVELGHLGLTLVARDPREVGRAVGRLIRDATLRSLLASRAQAAVEVSGLGTLTEVLRRL